MGRQVQITEDKSLTIATIFEVMGRNVSTNPKL